MEVKEINDLIIEVESIKDRIGEIDEEIEVFEENIQQLENLKSSLEFEMKEIKEQISTLKTNCKHESMKHLDEKVICSVCEKVLPNQIILDFFKE